MILVNDGIFRLQTVKTSLWFRVSKFGHLEHIYYGPRLEEQNVEALVHKRTSVLGSSVLYDKDDPTYCLDTLCLEWSGIGRGDYRHSPIEAKMPDNSFNSDFIFDSYKIISGFVPMEQLPSSYGEQKECQSLEITLVDKSNKVDLVLYYTVYKTQNVITRRSVMRNKHKNPLVLRRFMSMMMDIPNRGFQLISLDGAWIKEAQVHARPIQYGLYVNSSTTGASSNRHNPGFIIAEQHCLQDTGKVYGFNLVYSGNHYGAVELSTHDLLRVQLGINPHCFEWELKKDESFESPEAVMSFSPDGYNGLSKNFHGFVNNHIVRGPWKNKERPVLINSWEAFFFKFNQRKLLGLARRAKKIGAELFVLDDGWFGTRNSDESGLGDYWVNRKKFPFGLSYFAKRIRGMGLEFGIWFEPEMINPDSDLFRKHPEFAVQVPGKDPVLGRNQLVLDICKKEVRDYIVESVGKILDETRATYVKWDMNRHISDAYSIALVRQGNFFHSYILGLYEIFTRIFQSRSHILLESCSSGGNRFDLGMLCFSPQIWTSDNTDPGERLKIQEGLSYFYPQSTMGAHVSEAPHQQTLRNTALSTRYNVAVFGCLGYELDLRFLSYQEKKEIKQQIEFYKEHRRLFQYGQFYRFDSIKKNKVQWQVLSKDKTKGVTGFYQTWCTASEGYDYIALKDLKKDSWYKIVTRPQRLFIKQFGMLVKHILPFTLNPDGLILRLANKFYSLRDCVENYEANTDLLHYGVKLHNQFVGCHYNENTRLLSDFGSNLYIFTKI